MNELNRRVHELATRTHLGSAASVWAREIAVREDDRPSRTSWLLNGVVWQKCRGCNATLYPYRALCSHCLSDELVWERGSGSGRLSATTLLHASFNPIYRATSPWPIGLVDHQCGLRFYAFLQSDIINVNDDVDLYTAPDYAGESVFIAVETARDSSASAFAFALADKLSALAETKPSAKG